MIQEEFKFESPNAQEFKYKGPIICFRTNRVILLYCEFNLAGSRLILEDLLDKETNNNNLRKL